MCICRLIITARLHVIDNIMCYISAAVVEESLRVDDLKYFHKNYEHHACNHIVLSTAAYHKLIQTLFILWMSSRFIQNICL